MREMWELGELGELGEMREMWFDCAHQPGVGGEITNFPFPQSPLPLIPRGGPEFPSPQPPIPSPQIKTDCLGKENSRLKVKISNGDLSFSVEEVLDLS